MRTRENFPVGHPSQIAPSQARLTWRFFRDRLPKKKMHLVDMITLLILLSLGPGYPIPGARISQLRRWSPAPRLGPRRSRQASGLRPIPLADPLQIHVVVGSEHGEGPPDAVMQRLAESAARVVTQGLQATLRGASRGDVIETKDPAEGRDGLGHGCVVGLLLLGRLGKCLGGLIEGRLEPCKQPKQKTSNTG
jgi:hypothetical protein